MKKNFFYLAMAACVALCNLSCSGSDDGGGSQDPIDPLAYASKAVAYVLSEGTVNAEGGNASLTAINFTEAGKAVIEITENGKKKFATYNVKIDGNTYTITDDKGNVTGVVTSSASRNVKSATVNVNITVTIGGVTYVFTTNSAAADVQYDTMTGGDALTKIARTWKVDNMKLTLESEDKDFKSLSMIEYSGKLSAFVAEVKARDTGFSDEDIARLDKEIKSLTLDKTGMFDIEYTDGSSDVAVWSWKDGNYANIALKLKDSEAGNKFIQDNTNIAVSFADNKCRFLMVTTLERSGKLPFVATLNVVMSAK